MSRNRFSLHTRSAWLVLVAVLLLAGCGSSGGEGLKDLSEGKLAPGSATLKWEREIEASTTPRHIIRRYTSPDPAAAVARYYNGALTDRGWEAAPGGDAGYAEWSREGMVISLVFEANGGAGSEWSLALFAAP